MIYLKLSSKLYPLDWLRHITIRGGTPQMGWFVKWDSGSIEKYLDFAHFIFLGMVRYLSNNENNIIELS